MDFGTTLYNTCTDMIGCVLPLPTLHRSKYLFHHDAISKDVTPEFYRQLYPRFIRDIEVSSQCMLSFYSCERVREGRKEVAGVEGEGRGTEGEWEVEEDEERRGGGE